MPGGWHRERALAQDIQTGSFRCPFLFSAFCGACVGSDGYQVHEYLSRFHKYDWLWKEDKDVQYQQFVASNPAISDYEVKCYVCYDDELGQSFVALEAEHSNAMD